MDEAGDARLARPKSRSVSVAPLCIPARHIVAVAVIMGIGTFAICYAISLTNGTMEHPYYFLSSSIYAEPSRNIAVVGLVPSLACLPVLGWLRHSLVEAGCGKSMKRCNTASLYSCALAACGGLGVCAYPADPVNVEVHLMFATIFFFFALVASIANVIIDWYKMPVSWGTRVRLGNCVVGAVCIVSLGAICLEIAVNHTITVFPENYVIWMSILELLFFAATMNIFGSFYFDFEGVSLTLGVACCRGEAENEPC